MTLVSKSKVKCPACGKDREQEVVLSINTKTDPKHKERMLAGELNVLVCSCGKRTVLASNLLYNDPDAHYLCQVCVGDEAAMKEAEANFARSGAQGAQRVVPSLNALIEKVKLLDAGLHDWAVEMTKVLLLASIGQESLNRVLLFSSKEGGVINWVLFDEDGRSPQTLSSPMTPYERGLAQWKSVAPHEGEYRIDREWAVRALQRVMPLPV